MEKIVCDRCGLVVSEDENGFIFGIHQGIELNGGRIELCDTCYHGYTLLKQALDSKAKTDIELFLGKADGNLVIALNSVVRYP